MTLEDLPEVLKIEQSLFSDAWTQEHYQYELLENPYSTLYCLWNQNEIIGYFGFWITFEICQLTTIGVRVDQQGKGYGRLLLKKLEEEAVQHGCETIMLEVRVSNDKAKALYESEGYIPLNIRKSYYSDNFEDAQVMAKGIGEMDDEE